MKIIHLLSAFASAAFISAVFQIACLLALIVAPVGAPVATLYVKVCTGRSASVALAVKVSSEPSLIVLFVMAARTGATFTSVTVIVTASLVVATPSLTEKVTTLLLAGASLFEGDSPIAGIDAGLKTSFGVECAR